MIIPNMEKQKNVWNQQPDCLKMFGNVCVLGNHIMSNHPQESPTQPGGTDVFLTFALSGRLSTRLPARLSTSGTEQGMAGANMLLTCRTCNVNFKPTDFRWILIDFADTVPLIDWSFLILIVLAKNKHFYSIRSTKKLPGSDQHVPGPFNFRNWSRGEKTHRIAPSSKRYLGQSLSKFLRNLVHRFYLHIPYCSIQTAIQ